jgi:hypothetical protein
VENLDPNARLTDIVRVEIYRYFISHASAPTARDIATILRHSVTEIEAAFVELADARVITLAPSTRSMWMVHPFSAVPTPYRVNVGQRSYWANCAWDALGIAAIIGSDSIASAGCPDCLDQIDLSVRNQTVDDSAGVVHFAVPPSKFWDNVAYT